MSMLSGTACGGIWKEQKPNAACGDFIHVAGFEGMCCMVTPVSKEHVQSRMCEA